MPSRRRAVLAPLAAVAILLPACGTSASDAPDTDQGPGADADTLTLVVAGAAVLRPAFTELGASFEERTGVPVTFSFGSSGLLAQQLIEGAPMDVYASADAAFVDRVLDAGVGDAASRTTYATGRITIWSRTSAWGGWDTLADVAADPDVRNIAIANPEHAPYGRAAKQALEAAGVWEDLRPRLVFGENISDTQRLAATGNADVAIVALALALAADAAQGSDGPSEGRWVLIDDALHAPLRQDLIVTATAPDRIAAAERFLAHLASEEGQSVMRRFGFVRP
jgi:molybdate transport system substrate-binding protein